MVELFEEVCQENDAKIHRARNSGGMLPRMSIALPFDEMAVQQSPQDHTIKMC